MTERQVGRSDAEYPHRLEGIDVPDTLWVHGAVSLNPDRTVAIVGTRSPFHVSAEIAQAIGRVAAKLGHTVVSGYATGIDTAGHWGAADEDAPTIAVLGSGIRQKEPLKPALERYILSKGVFVSEVPAPNARRAIKHLLDRNRITAALADVVIVVETEPAGGAAATAWFARERQRKVYAVVWHGHEDYEDSRRRGSDDLVVQGVARPLHILDDRKKYTRPDLEPELRRALLCES
ncbi:MAG: DNA-processing protein DprA [Gammaproteobacteria bacterium]